MDLEHTLKLYGVNDRDISLIINFASDDVKYEMYRTILRDNSIFNIDMKRILLIMRIGEELLNGLIKVKNI